MNLPCLGNGHWHVAGVGGVGMSALAQALRWTGGRVTGSDRFLDRGTELPVFATLRAAGVELVPQNSVGIEPGMEALVYSTAIEDDNPDIVAARAANVPIRHRAEVLSALVEGERLLAVAGTAGKTTTTGMLAWALERVGADPWMVDGGGLVAWASSEGGGGNVRRGAPGAPWAVELDESDRSFLRFHPAWSIITNISQDHFELDEVRRLFAEYATHATEGIVCGPSVAEIIRPVVPASLPVVTPDATLAQASDGTWSAAWRDTILSVPSPGRHNLWNALCAAELCVQAQQVAPADVAAALRTFPGIVRRLEEVGGGPTASGGIRVLDDYAHNPAKIAAAWLAVRPADRAGRVLGLWRPHGYGPLRSMLGEFAETFSNLLCDNADELWLLPVFDAGGTASRTISSADLRNRLPPDLRNRVHLVSEATSPGWHESLAAQVAAQARLGDTVLVMGARDPALPLLARATARHCAR